MDSTPSAPREIPFLQAPLGWLTLGLALLAALPFGAVEPGVWALLAIFLLVIFALQLVYDGIFGVPLVARRLIWPALPFALALVWCAIQTLPLDAPGLIHPAWTLVPDTPGRISADPIYGAQGLLRYTLYLTVFWIVLRSAANPERAGRMLSAIALWSTALAVYGLWSYATGANPILLETDDVVKASFYNRNSYATYAAFGAIANLGAYLRSIRIQAESDTDSRALRDFLESFFSGAWIYLVGALICFAAVLGTESRAGAAAAVFGVFCYLALQARSRGAATRFAVPTMAAILVFSLSMLTAGVAGRILTTSDEAGRFLIYPKILEGVWDRPLLGHGLGAFHDAFRAYVPLEGAGAEWDLAHSSYLENAFEMGLPAAGLFYLALVILTLQMFQGNMKRRTNRSFSSVALGVLVAGAVHSIFDFSLQIPAVTLLFVSLLAVGYAQSQPTQGKIRRVVTPARSVPEPG